MTDINSSDWLKSQHAQIVDIDHVTTKSGTSTEIICDGHINWSDPDRNSILSQEFGFRLNCLGTVISRIGPTMESQVRRQRQEQQHFQKQIPHKR